MEQLLREMAVSNPNAEIWDECVQLRESLRNCLLLAMREAHRGKVGTANRAHWQAIIRFCKEAGVEPSPLREADSAGESDAE